MSAFRSPTETAGGASMARRSPIDLLVSTRIAALAASLPAALGGDPVAVHRTRVASRRLREVTPVLDAVLPSAAGAGTAVRRVTRALGPVRELDVTSRLYAEVMDKEPVHPLAQAAIGRTLIRERASAMRAAGQSLSASRRATLWARLDALVSEVAGLRVAAIAGTVRARLERRAGRVGAALDHLGVLYAPDRLHEVRIAVKQLRYTLEIAGRLRCAPAAAALRQLRAVQELLGRAHDLHVLAEHVRQVEGRVISRSRPAARDLRRVAEGLDAECRRIHGSFLRRRDALHALAGALAAAPARSRRRAAA